MFNGDLGFGIVDQFLEMGRSRDAIVVNRAYASSTRRAPAAIARWGLLRETWKALVAIDNFTKR